MDLAGFENALKRDGFDDISTGGFPAGHNVGAHAHPYAVRALVVEGEFRIAVDGNERIYRPGDIFALDLGTQHTESTGPTGAKFLIGRKR